MSIRGKYLKFLQSLMPPVSRTEQEALDAGTTSAIEGSLYNGSPDWKAIVGGYDPGELTAEEKAFIENETEELCEMLDDYQIEQDGDLPKAVWDYIKDKKFLGMLISKEYGGLGFSARARSAVVTKLSTRSATAAVTVMVPNSLGPGELLSHYGTQEQKDRYLQSLATGKDVPCFALTEPNAGSDAGNIQAKGIVKKDPKTGEVGISLTWNKRYITLAPVATVLGLAYHLEDPENLLGKGEKPGITVSLIPTSTTGVEIGNRHRPMDMAFMNGTTRGKDVFVPLDSIVGGADNAGKGWRMLVECLSEGRANSLPSMGSATGQLQTYTTTAYSTIRQQFGTKIKNFEGVSEKIADMAGKAYAIRALKDATLDLVDSGEKPAIPSAIAKYHATELGRDTVMHGMDVQAGKGIISGPSNYTQGSYKAIPIAITVEGANILTRNMLIFGQGSYRLHPYFQPMQEAVAEEKTMKATWIGLKLVGSQFVSAARSLYANSGLKRLFSPKSHLSKEMREYAHRIDQVSASFNAVANPTSSILGAKLKFKERASAKFGDVLSHLYIASSVIRQYEKRGANPAELSLARYAIEDNLHKAHEALTDVLQKDTYPMGGFFGNVVRLKLKVLSGTFGHRHKKPSGKLQDEITKSLSENGDTLKLLTEEVYFPKESGGPIADLKKAFEGTLAAQDLEKKLNEADRQSGLKQNEQFADRVANAVTLGVLTQDEAKELLEVYEARMRVVNVDEVKKEDYRPAVNPS
ncbi:MAG: acyl-CoA dehydrogenase [Alphaproteobacteria bacterium]